MSAHRSDWRKFVDGLAREAMRKHTIRRAYLSMRRLKSSISPRTVVGGLVWGVLPALILVQLLASVILHNHQFKAMEDQLADQVAKLAASRSAILAEPLWRMQYTKVQSVLSEIATTDAITHAAVIDDTGEVVASFGSAPAADSPEYLSVKQTITYVDGNHRAVAGRLVIDFNSASIAGQYSAGLQNALLVSVLASVATLFCIWWATDRAVGRPLSAISDAIERTKSDGRWVKAAVTSHNEIGLLARAFNDMQDTQRRAQERLAHIACHDGLTGLPNRRHFETIFDALLRSGEDQSIALHFVDMDGFKKINDTFGHEAGDQFLIQVADRLRATAGPRDTVARVGGDEFLILQPDVAHGDDAQALARRLIDTVSEPVVFDGVAIVPQCCIGIAIRHAASPDARNLRALADVALYDAKAGGPGQIAALTDERFQIFQRVRSLEDGLPAALAAQQFDVWYQAQIDLRTNRVVAIEALSRWQHTAFGMVNPGEFLPLVERNRLNHRLTGLVLDRACVMVQRMQDAGHHGIRVALNISAQELSDENVVGRIRECADRHGVPLSAFEVEITEGAVIDNFAIASRIIGRLRDQGVSVALDDFGTGYSSLAYLRRLQIDKLKVDKAFVRDVTQDVEARAVLETISTLAERLGLQLVAEGIEEMQQLGPVQFLGVEIGQGYLFHRPQPMAQCLEFLDAVIAKTATGHTAPVLADGRRTPDGPICPEPGATPAAA